MRLSGKTAVITGGGTGIGAACALALAGEGCQVAILGRREDKLKELAQSFSGKPALLVHAADVADRSSVNAALEWAHRELGHIDILINAAGINVVRRTMAELSPEDWDRLLQVNATGAFNCIHAVLPGMKAQRDGLIVNISSTSGLRSSPLGGVGYNASKFAMSALGIAVAEEMREYGIRVSNVHPGEVDTPILDNRPTPVTSEHRAKILKPDDVAQAILMIACLPPRAEVLELVIKPTLQSFV